jgi:transcription antitermination factor NusG
MTTCSSCKSKVTEPRFFGGKPVCLPCLKRLFWRGSTLHPGKAPSKPVEPRSGARAGQTPTQPRKPLTSDARAPSQPPTPAHSRCEGCYQLRLHVTLQQVGKDWLCPICREPKPRWYCAAISGNDMKVRKKIRKRVDDQGLGHLLKRIVIPKVRTVRKTLDRYEAISTENVVLGEVSATDSEEALYKAKEAFQPRRKKGVYKPEHTNGLDQFKELRKTYDKLDGHRRVVWEAIGQSGKVMGRIYEPDRGKAAEQAERLYGEKDKVDRFDVRSGDVQFVRKVKDGGKTLVQNKRAMPGYLLLQMFDDRKLWTSIRSVGGVYSILPFKEKMTFEDIEKEDEPEAVYDPTGIPEDQIEKVVEPPAKPPVTVTAGDSVRITGGPFRGQRSVVEEVEGDAGDTAVVTLRVEVLGKKTVVKVPHTVVAKE